MKELVVVGGISLDVDFDYTPGSPGHNVFAGPDPVAPEPSELVINTIHIGDVDVTELYSTSYRKVSYESKSFESRVTRYIALMDDIEEAVMQVIQSARDYEAEARADAMDIARERAMEEHFDGRTR